MGSNREFHHNHYVPEWYQRRFMLPGQNRYWYLDLNPDPILRDGKVIAHRRDLLPWGPSKCFAENDLYTTKWGAEENVDIEKFFFGRVDTEGKSAVEFFSDFQFDHPDQHDAFNGLMNYMSVQKLRTPKGLGWLGELPAGRNRNHRLMLLQEIQNVFCATWAECVWLIADATKSDTKFIISDHPVTVYNRACFPGSVYCKGFNDPDIRMVATHTYFPLSIDKVLILTNLAWVRNPYQNEREPRPNPGLFRNTIMSLQDIQTCRRLGEQEVLEINYITKKRALRYIAAAEKEWLYPERQLPSTHWSKFGHGYLLMPEPREVHIGGETYVGYKDGTSEGWNEYGQRPGQRGFKDARRDAIESKTLLRFQAEFAEMQGPEYRGTTFFWSHHRDEKGPHVDSDDYHQHLLEIARRHKRHH
jgi:hypothetical protein